MSKCELCGCSLYRLDDTVTLAESPAGRMKRCRGCGLVLPFEDMDRIQRGLALLRLNDAGEIKLLDPVVFAKAINDGLRVYTAVRCALDAGAAKLNGGAE